MKAICIIIAVLMGCTEPNREQHDFIERGGRDRGIWPVPEVGFDTTWGESFTKWEVRLVTRPAIEWLPFDCDRMSIHLHESGLILTPLCAPVVDRVTWYDIIETDAHGSDFAEQPCYSTDGGTICEGLSDSMRITPRGE